MAVTAEMPLSVRALDHIEAGQVRVRCVDEDGLIVADVGAYTVRRTPNSRRSCQCVAASYGNRCSHAVGVMLVSTGPEGSVGRLRLAMIWSRQSVPVFAADSEQPRPNPVALAAPEPGGLER